MLKTANVSYAVAFLVQDGTSAATAAATGAAAASQKRATWARGRPKGSRSYGRRVQCPAAGAAAAGAAASAAGDTDDPPAASLYAPALAVGAAPNMRSAGNMSQRSSTPVRLRNSRRQRVKWAGSLERPASVSGATQPTPRRGIVRLPQLRKDGTNASVEIAGPLRKRRFFGGKLGGGGGFERGGSPAAAAPSVPVTAHSEPVPSGAAKSASSGERGASCFRRFLRRRPDDAEQSSKAAAVMAQQRPAAGERLRRRQHWFHRKQPANSFSGFRPVAA